MRDYSLGTVCFSIYWYSFLLICGCAGRHSLFCRTMDAPDVQQSMGYKESRGGMPKFFHALGPALLISMGYIDLGKWVAAVEDGSCFGFDLIYNACKPQPTLEIHNPDMHKDAPRYVYTHLIALRYLADLKADS